MSSTNTLETSVSKKVTVVGFVVATLQLAVAEVLQVVMDIEANTRS
jgi:hypothetical protein